MSVQREAMLSSVLGSPRTTTLTSDVDATVAQAQMPDESGVAWYVPSVTL